MSEDPRKTVEALLRPLFPNTALILASESDGGMVISAGWRLGTNRMDNWSKEIRLVIPSAILERYGKLNETGRFKANGNFVSYFKLKLADFQPAHDHPRYLMPPQVVWEVKYEDIFPSGGG